MNTSQSNPFTGLKGALAGLMSGGWMGLLLGLLFRRRIAPMLAALETLFAQWKAGTLAPLAVALPIPAVPASAAASPAAPRARRRVAAPRRRARAGRRCPIACATTPRPQRATVFHPRTQDSPAPGQPAAAPSHHHDRCTSRLHRAAHRRTPKLLRCRNNQ
jgi:hypothetical protein